MTKQGGGSKPEPETRLAQQPPAKKTRKSRVVFTPERRARLIGHVEAGGTIEDACLAAGVCRSTVMRWQRKGRKDPGSEMGEFAAALEVARGAGRAIERRNLSQEDLVALLEERAAERRCLKSIELLLMRPWERHDGDREQEPAGPSAPLDELAARRAA